MKYHRGYFMSSFCALLLYKKERDCQPKNTSWQNINDVILSLEYPLEILFL